MKVNKKELAKRTFIPYEIIITVETQEDHDNLVKDLKPDFDTSLITKTFDKLGSTYSVREAILNIFKILKEHI